MSTLKDQFQQYVRELVKERAGIDDQKRIRNLAEDVAQDIDEEGTIVTERLYDEAAYLVGCSRADAVTVLDEFTKQF